MLTPWGDADDLRARSLRAGPRLPPAKAARNQRERLFAAMVAVCAERGYDNEAVSAEEVIGLAGVSKRDFYRHFADREACFLACLEEALRLRRAAVTARVRERAGGGGLLDEEVLRAGLELAHEQAAAARLCLVGAFAAGPRAAARVRGELRFYEALMARSYRAAGEGREMPAAIVGGLVAGIGKLLHTRLRRGREAELPGLVPDLLALLRSYRVPPRALRAGRRLQAASEEQGHRSPRLEQVDPSGSCGRRWRWPRRAATGR